MSADYQTLTEDAISMRLHKATLSPRSLITEIRTISREYHLACENMEQMDSHHTEPKGCFSQNIVEGLKKHPPFCRELTAYVACLYGRGVFLVQSAAKNPARRNYFLWGQLQDIEFTGRLQRALAMNIAQYSAYKRTWFDFASGTAFERGTLIGLLRQILTSNGSEENEHSVVDSIVRRKEAIAIRKLKVSGFVRLRDNMTPLVVERVEEIAMNLGSQAGAEL